ISISNPLFLGVRAMKSIFAFLCALLLLSTAANSQTLPCSDPSATRVDTFQVSITLQSGLRISRPRTNAGSGSGHIIWEVILERTSGSGGQDDYIINMPTISF